MTLGVLGVVFRNSLGRTIRQRLDSALGFDPETETGTPRGVWIARLEDFEGSGFLVLLCSIFLPLPEKCSLFRRCRYSGHVATNPINLRLPSADLGLLRRTHAFRRALGGATRGGAAVRDPGLVRARWCEMVLFLFGFKVGRHQSCCRN